MALPHRPQLLHAVSPEGKQSNILGIEGAVEHEIANVPISSPRSLSDTDLVPGKKGGFARRSHASSATYDLDEEGIVLLPPPSTWDLCSPSPEPLRFVRFSKQETVANASVIQQWFETAGVTTLHVGFEHLCSWDVVVVDGQCLQALPKKGDEYTVEFIDPTEPSDREKDVYGINQSTWRAWERFLRSALDGIFHIADGRVSQFYRATAKQSGLLARLEMMVFCVEFERSAYPVKSSFICNAHLLCLNLLGEFDSSDACELLRRDYQDWYHHILDGATRLLCLPLPNHLLHRNREEIELQVVSQLYDLLNVSGGEVTKYRNNELSPGLTYLTPLDILIFYGHAFEVQTPTPRHFGTSDIPALQKALSRSRIFVRVTHQNAIRTTDISDVRVWICHLKDSLPIAFPDLALPPNLLSELGFQEMKQFQMFWSVAARPKPKTMIADGSSERIYEQIPSLNRSENNVLLLLAWSSECTGRVLRALHAWAVSTHGQAVYRRLVEHLGLPSTPAQVALDLVALLSFLRLQPYGSSRTDEAKANHLSDFHSLLKGSPSSKARETIEHETWSFCIATSSWIDADEVQRMFQLLACVFDVVSIPECSDEDSGRYWTGRFNPPRSHDSALLTMPDVVGNFTLAVQPDLPRLNGNGSIIESEFATDGSSQAVANRSSEVLMQSSNEKVSKRRSCFRWGWFCGAM